MAHTRRRTWGVDVVESFLQLRNGIPISDTYSRGTRLLDLEPVHIWFPEFINRVAEERQGMEAIYGKPCGIIAHAKYAWLLLRYHWPGSAPVGKVTTTRRKNVVASQETRYCLMSQAYSPQRFNEIALG